MKNKILITTLPYNEVSFKFISNHYDVHLNGTCIYNRELCEFENKYPEYNEALDDWEEMFVKIYKLDFLHKLNWYLKQWLFEKCVGYHWTYPYRKTGKRSFGSRKPKWFYNILYKAYYNLKKIKTNEKRKL